MFDFLLSNIRSLEKQLPSRIIAWEKRLSPRRAPRLSLLPHSSRRTQVRLKPLLSLPGWRQTYTEPTGVLRCKSTVCGLNGLRPTLRVGALHLKSSTAFRALAPAASFRGSLCCACFGQKIWHTIFFSSKTNFKIFPKLLPNPREASPFQKSSSAMVLPRCLAWNISPCLLAKRLSLLP